MARRVKKHYSKEATMTDPKPPKKRVRKREFTLEQRRTMWNVTAGLLIILLSFVLVVWGIFFTRWMPLVLTAIPVGFGFFYLWFGMRLANRAKVREAVKLLTPQKASELPAEDTLLRASTEPTQAQEKVLLRAATSGAETPPEQLLRADVAPTS
jgi:hypothetical protein